MRWQRGLFHALLPGMWLLLYGAAIVTAGSFSVRVVPIMGLCLMPLAPSALFVPRNMGDLFMAFGFGFVQIGFRHLDRPAVRGLSMLLTL